MGFLSSDRLKVACALAMIAYMYSSLNNLVTGKKNFPCETDRATDLRHPVY